MDKPVEILWKAAMFLSCWFGVLALLGIGRKYLNQNNRLTRYLSVWSFQIYLFHFVWVAAIQYFLARLTTNTILLFLLSVIGGFILTVLTCEAAAQIKKAGMRIFKKHKHSASNL